MPLNWSVKDVKDWESFALTGDGKEWTVETQAIVWHSLSCGFREITEKNVRTVALRIFAWEKIHGAMIQSSNGSVYLTFDKIKKFIGFKSNANVLNDKQFAQGIGENIIRSVSAKLPRKGE